MHWLKNYAFGSHLVDWLALAVVVVLILALASPREDLSSGGLRTNATKAKLRRNIGASMVGNEMDANETGAYGAEGNPARQMVSSVMCHVTWQPWNSKYRRSLQET